MTLTTTTPTTSELWATYKAFPLGQQNALIFAYRAYERKHAQGFLCRKGGTTLADAQALCPTYLTQTGDETFALTDLGLAVYQAMLNQPPRPNKREADILYHGTGSRHVRERYAQRLGSGILTKPAEPEAKPATTTAAAVEPTPIAEPVPVLEFAPAVESKPAPIQLPAFQLDVSPLIQPLLLQIAALESKVATLAEQPSQAVSRRRPRPAMPPQIVKGVQHARRRTSVPA